MKISKFRPFQKGFRAYYLLVISIVVLTITIQSMTQYSLRKQRSTAMIVNLAGKQRMLSQRILNELYSCRYHNCDYAELKLVLTKLYQMNGFLQRGNESLKIEPLEDEEILAEFARLEPHLEWLYSELNSYKKYQTVSFNDVRFRVDRFLVLMDGIVTQFQKKAEKDIKTMMIIELELAIFSIVIILFEIFFIVNPIIRRILDQKKKLTEIAWHQSHVFRSHMKNISDLQYVLKVEKNPERQREIYGFVMEELDHLKKVSRDMENSLEKTVENPKPHHLVIKKVEDFLEKHKLLTPYTETIDGGKVHSSK
ncbi:type IV pili methyl-accepting chemotaxis transducer N-terminal domain-containing protein [Flagellimonas sp. 2504JD4-2]